MSIRLKELRVLQSLVLLRGEELHVSTSVSTQSCAGANLLLLNTTCNCSPVLRTVLEI
jgi:hypothetical protein